MRLEIECKNLTDTKKCAESIAKICKAPKVISLCGDLGAGKTTFAKSFIASLGITQNVTSPTFTLLNEYENGDVKIYHFDMYRLASSDEAYEAGFERYFAPELLDGITLVEWAENTPDILPKNYMKITFEKLGENERKIVIEEI